MKIIKFINFINMKKYVLLSVVVLGVVAGAGGARADTWPRNIQATDGDNLGNTTFVSSLSFNGGYGPYRLFRSAAWGTTVSCTQDFEVKKNSIGPNFFDDASLPQPGVRYLYATSAYDSMTGEFIGGGFSLLSGLMCSLTAPNPIGNKSDYGFRSPPPAPASPSASTNLTDKVTLNWVDLLKSGVIYDPKVTYEVQRNNALQITGLTATSWNDVSNDYNVVPGVSYNYQIRTKAQDGSYSAWSTIVVGSKLATVTPPTPQKARNVVASTNLTDKIHITWDPPAGSVALGAKPSIMYRCVT